MKLIKPNKGLEEFESLKLEIGKCTMEFQRDVQLKKISAKERNEFIIKVLPKFDKLISNPHASFKDKIIFRSSKIFLNKCLVLPIKK